MPKRFTATEKWIDPWFCKLKPIEKLFWIYLLDNCDHAGIWQINWPLVNFHLGNFEFDEDIFNGRIIKLKKEKWYIPKFVSFQYGELNPDNRMHLSVMHILEKEGAIKPLISPLIGAKDKDKDKDKDKEQDKDKIKDKVKDVIGGGGGKEKEKEDYMILEKAILEDWNSLCNSHPILPRIREITPARRLKLKKRFEQPSFRNFAEIVAAIKEQPFLLGENDRKWKVCLDWLIENDTNYVKVLERKYKKEAKSLNDGFHEFVRKE